MSDRSAGAGIGTTRPIVALVATIGVTLVVHTAWTVFHFGGPRVTTIVDDLGPLAAAALAVVLTARRGRVEADRITRLGWRILSASCVGLAGGQLIGAVYEVVLQVPLPFPSIADVFYVSSTCLEIPVVLLLGGPMRQISRLRLLLDGSVVALGVLLVS